jgi:TRAP-type mannitol/chloroaromatic compound transport system substrate-binding protein
MQRRRLLSTTPAAALALGLGARPLRAQETVRWTMVMPWPKTTPGLGTNSMRFAEMVEAMSGGRLAMTVYGAGELVPPFECLDAVQTGTADLMHGTPYYWAGKSAALHFFTTTPFGLTAEELAGWLYKGDGMALWREAYEPFGVIPFYAGNSRIQAGGWFTREINGLADLDGLKMRIAGLGGEVLRRLGVNTVLIAPGDIMPALMAGTVDAAEWVGPWNDRAFGLQRAARYYYVPAFHEPGAGLELTVNRNSFEALPRDLQTIVEVAAAAITTETVADFAYNSILSFEPLLEEGVELRFWPDDVVEALGRTTREVMADLAAGDPMAAKVHASVEPFLAACDRYAQAFDARMIAMRARALAAG